MMQAPESCCGVGRFLPLPSGTLGYPIYCLLRRGLLKKVRARVATPPPWCPGVADSTRLNLLTVSGSCGEGGVLGLIYCFPLEAPPSLRHGLKVFCPTPSPPSVPSQTYYPIDISPFPSTYSRSLNVSPPHHYSLWISTSLSSTC